MQAPVGTPAAVQILDWLIVHGVKEIISGGSCGVLTSVEEDAFSVSHKTLRDEETSYHYLPPSPFAQVSETERGAIEKTPKRHNLSCIEVTTWSTNGFYRETKEKVEYRKIEGCAVVEMECSALAACAQLKGNVWGELLFTADALADAEHYDEENLGGNSVEYTMELCVEAVLNI